MPISTQCRLASSFTPFPPHHLASSFAPISPPHIFWPHCMVCLRGRQFAWVTSRHPVLSGRLTTSQITVLRYCLNTSPISIHPPQRYVSINSILIDCMQGFLSTSSSFTLASTSTTTTGLIAWSAFEADKLCLGDFASSSNVWLSDYESDASKMRQCLFILCELCACPAILFFLIV